MRTDESDLLERAVDRDAAASCAPDDLVEGQQALLEEATEGGIEGDARAAVDLQQQCAQRIGE